MLALACAVLAAALCVVVILAIFIWLNGKRLAPAKPRIRLRQDGWVRHLGGPFPFDGDCIVEVLLAGGVSWSPQAAPQIPEQWWRGQADDPRHDVLFYRIVSHRRSRSRWS